MVKEIWIQEVADVVCPNSLVVGSINTIAGCQALCEAKSGLECVGIAYSKEENTDDCHLCRDDTTNTMSDFGFYRRPGISKIVSS